MRLNLLPVLLLLAPLASWSGPGATPQAPRYDERSLRMGGSKPRDESEEGLRGHVRAAARGRIERFQRRNVRGEKEDVSLKALSTPELFAVFIAISFELRGAENDLIVKDFQGQRYPVSVWWDEPKVLVVQAGEAWENPVKPDLDAATVQARHGVGAIQDGNRAWDPAALTLLDEALSRLSEEERGRIRDVPFVRRKTPPAAVVQELQGKPAATYIYDEQGPRLELYDEAVNIATRFSGTPDAPQPYALNVLLHEIGHAIAHHDRREERLALEKATQRHHALYDQSQKAYDALQKQRTRVRTAAERDTYQAAVRDFEALQAENNALATDVEARANRLRLLVKQPTPAAASLKRVLGRKGAPTYYGLTSTDEAFADCFSLFRGDPAALRRARPRGYEWFSGGGHLAASDGLVQR